MPTQFAANVKIGQDIFVNDVAVLYLSYRMLWDKGSRLDLLIFDPDCMFHRSLEDLGGSPSPPVEFQLEYEPSAGALYKNKGTKHTLYLIKAGQVLTPLGLCLRLKAVDRGSMLLRSATLNHNANGVKASRFVEALADKVGVKAKMPDTGDNAGSHRAVRAKPIDAMRYELDRVLSGSGKPITLQFDDRTDQQILTGFEELYDAQTQMLTDSLTGGTYSYGVGIKENKGDNVSYGNAIYHWELDQDYRPAIWGHSVSVDHLNAKGEQVTGEVKSKLSKNLGIQGDILDLGSARLHLPMNGPDSATSDDYYAKAMMVNSVFQTEMAVTSGWMLIDSDYKAYDDPTILNRKHVVCALTGGTNQKSGHAIIPNQAVVMGFEHRMTRKMAYTKVHLRRGT